MPLNSSIAVEIYAYVGVAFGELEVHGLHTAARKCQRIQEHLQTWHMQVKYGEMASMLRELRERIEDDLHAVVFVCLSQEESQLYDQPEKDWEDVRRRFPKVRHDTEEVSKCFAFQRYSAALFHVLLVAEFGVIETAKLFGVEGDKPGWGCLDRLQRINDKKWTDKTSGVTQNRPCRVTSKPAI